MGEQRAAVFRRGWWWGGVMKKEVWRLRFFFPCFLSLARWSFAITILEKEIHLKLPAFSKDSHSFSIVAAPELV